MAGLSALPRPALAGGFDGRLPPAFPPTGKVIRFPVELRRGASAGRDDGDRVGSKTVDPSA